MMLLVRLLIALAVLSFGAQPVLCAEMPLEPAQVANDPCHQMDRQSPQMPERCPHQVIGMSTSAAVAILAPNSIAASYLVLPIAVAPVRLVARMTAADVHPPFRLRTLVVDRTLLRI